MHFCFFDAIVALITDDNWSKETMYEALQECLAEVIQKGLELVFGDKTSPGFICGVKEAVL
jgi:hypothetical protein